MKKTVNIILSLGILLVMACSHSNTNVAKNDNSELQHSELSQRDSASVIFIQDLEDFVISIEKQSVVQTVDWETTGELWNALQKRKESLLEKFSDVQMERIEILESRYNKIEDSNKRG